MKPGFEWDEEKARANLRKHGIISCRKATPAERRIYEKGHE